MAETLAVVIVRGGGGSTEADIRFELIKAKNMTRNISQRCYLSAFQHISPFNCTSNNREAS